MKTPPDDAGPLLPGPLETTAPISNAASRAWRSLGHLSGAWSAALRAATLNRALRNLGIRGKDVMLVSGMGKVRAEPTVQVFSVPGIGRDALAPEFKRFLENRVGGKWQDCLVGDVAARSCKVTFAEPTTLLWFALDGFAVYLATTDDEAVQSMSISLLNTLGA